MLLRGQPETLRDEVLHPLNGVVAQGKSISITAVERLVGEGRVGPLRADFEQSTARYAYAAATSSRAPTERSDQFYRMVV